MKEECKPLTLSEFIPSFLNDIYIKEQIFFMAKSKGIGRGVKETFWGLTRKQREIKREKKKTAARVKALVKKEKHKIKNNGNKSRNDIEFKL